MSHELPGVPEIRYDDLVSEARSRIPALAPDWTDHGPADTGIAVIELLAWVTEIIGYRAGRETDAMTRAFLELLAGAGAGGEGDIEATLQSTLEALWTRYRAATAADFVHLAKDEFPASPEGQALGAGAELEQVVCLADRNVDAKTKRALAPGHVSVVIIPRDRVIASKAQLGALQAFFEPRRLLTAQVHVAAVAKVYVPVLTDVYLDEGAVPATIHQKIWATIDSYYSPYAGGGADGEGMKIGAEVFLSDLYRRIDAIDGVDFVARVSLIVDDANRSLKNERAEVIGLAIYPHEIAVHGSGRTKIRLFEPLASGGWEEVSQ
ncbi:MAG: baseplate J/gp47 family protein [Myxococcales bacterium]|nr:baseplate J/gp47 family protein [Myxococcales bacterium]MCB9566044.1 baseplate J/gp47 family protein [Myxococcales bacterium]MCB9702776.1 baseplate J/gp47 family protein [Myxococcales bacterium]